MSETEEKGHRPTDSTGVPSIGPIYLGTDEPTSRPNYLDDLNGSNDQKGQKAPDKNGPSSGSQTKLARLANLKSPLSRLGNLNILSKLGPKSWSPTRKGAAVIIVIFLIVMAGVIASFTFLGTKEDISIHNEAILNSALDAAWNWVDGSEAAPIFTKPPWLNDLSTAGPKCQDLAMGINAFLDFRFEEALASFQKLAVGYESDSRVLSLLAATNLRLLNYGQAKLYYTQALAGTTPEKGGLKEASDRLGLALALFHQQEYDQSLDQAGISWRLRNQLLGPADSKSLAAVNSMATSLMALSRSAVAGDLLLEAVAHAIENGADQNQPVMRDSLGILLLAFEAQGRGDELKALFQPPEQTETTDTASNQTEGQTDFSASTSELPDPEKTEAQTSVAQAETSEPKPTQPEISQTNQSKTDQSPTGSTIDRDEARSLIENLKNHYPNSRVLPALALALVNDLTQQAKPPCRSPYPDTQYNDFLSLCLDVAKGYASVNELNESSAILDSLTQIGLNILADKGELSKPRLIEALALLASEKTELKDFPSAEVALRQAREVAATMPKDDPQTLTSLVILSLRLSDTILTQKRPPIEAELELVTGLTTIKKIFNKRTIETHPLIPVLYLRLAWLVGAIGRSKDANAYRDLASRSLKAVTKAHPEYKATTEAISQAYEENRRGKMNQNSLANLWRPVLPANRPAQPPASPEVMRIELSALKLLNRLPEFKALIDSAIQWSASTHGPDSQIHRRYQSLNLKYLEESGNLDDLLTALDQLAADPGTTQEPQRTAIMTAALKYKARVLEEANQTADAIEALSQARLKILDNQALLDRLPEIEAEINRLNTTLN
jgi:hypothetical protein